MKIKTTLIAVVSLFISDLFGQVPITCNNPSYINVKNGKSIYYDISWQTNQISNVNNYNFCRTTQSGFNAEEAYFKLPSYGQNSIISISATILGGNTRYWLYNLTEINNSSSCSAIPLECSSPSANGLYQTLEYQLNTTNYDDEYIIVVDGQSNLTFEMTFNEIDPNVSGLNCNNATLIDCGESKQNMTHSSGTNAIQNYSNCMSITENQKERVYKIYSSKQVADLSIELEMNTNSSIPSARLYSDCFGTFLACGHLIAGNRVVLDYSGLVSGEYYLIVDGYAALNYNIYVECYQSEHSSSIKENISENISIYPNPVLDVLNLQFETIKNEMISIIDITGKTVKLIPINGINSQINISELQQGIYFIKGTNFSKIIEKL